LLRASSTWRRDSSGTKWCQQQQQQQGCARQHPYAAAPRMPHTHTCHTHTCHTHTCHTHTHTHTCHTQHHTCHTHLVKLFVKE
jgi:hypothetical protein